jgi:putative transposase
MNRTPLLPDLQDRVAHLAASIAKDKLLSLLLPKEQLEEFLLEGLSQLLNASLQAQRQIHLQHNPKDRANGFSPRRSVHLGSTAIPIEVPRSREGFYPSLLPKYQRHLPQSFHQLLSQILLHSKSFAAAKRTLQSLGLGYAPHELDQILEDIYLQAKEFNSRPLPSDWAALFIDAKHIYLKDQHGHILPATHFLVLGLSLDGKKEVLSAATFWGKEQLEPWKKVLVDLKNRGLSRTLLLVTDDFPGLQPLLKNLFPNSEHQLCLVHLHRNAKSHLDKTDYQLWQDTWRQINTCPSFETALELLTTLLGQLRSKNKAWISHLETRAQNYLAFFHYPRPMHAFLRTTNFAEGINNLLETIKRNAGGHFHSERETAVKIKLAIDQLHQGKWKKAGPLYVACQHELTQLFRQRFEDPSL